MIKLEDNTEQGPENFVKVHFSEFPLGGIGITNVFYCYPSPSTCFIIGFAFSKTHGYFIAFMKKSSDSFRYYITYDQGIVTISQA